MILSAQSIRAIPAIVSPFHERSTVRGMSYGLGPASYDVRSAERLVLTEGRFVLASTIEQFNMPTDILGQVCDKSTWARQGLFVQNTIIDPGWRGYLTLELSYHGDEGVLVIEGDPIAQIVFFRLDQPTNAPYSGKYQDQEAGAQRARMS